MDGNMNPAPPETHAPENEYIVPDNIALVSKTDLHGTITEVNDAFELASGFSREELIGQPHNIVRHPDVPKRVFKDMWHTLKMGATWSQVVKNRRKDGGYYWVKANVSPIYENNRHVGYLSFRTHVSESEKAATAEAYRQINAGKRHIQYGKVYQGINWPQLNWMAQMAPQWQLTLLMTIFAVIPFIWLTQHFLSVGLLAAISAMMLIPAFLYGLRLSRFQQSIQKALQNVSANEPINMSCHRPKHFVGQLINPVISAAISIRYAIEESQAKVDEAAMLQTAIDQVSSNLMITDANLNIVYMNDQMKQFMQNEEANIKQHLPDFNASQLIGQNIDVFHRSPQHQRQLLNQLKEPYLATIHIGDTHLEVNAIPIFNRAGLRTATLAEWRDKTQEVQLINQVHSTLEAAKNGVLDQRIDLSRVSGLARELSAAINDMLTTVELPISQAVNLGVALSEGNLTQQMEGQFSGRFALLQDSLNVALENLSNMLNQTRMTIDNVHNGAHEISQSSITLNERTQSQAASLQETAASMEEVTSAVQQNAENANQSSRQTQKTARQAAESETVMSKAEDSMTQIHESSQKINEIISLIDSIAFQTNLLP
jgi:methyl-accepting chemotaxis protein